jgi:hypothetical protein
MVEGAIRTLTVLITKTRARIRDRDETVFLAQDSGHLRVRGLGWASRDKERRSGDEGRDLRGASCKGRGMKRPPESAGLRGGLLGVYICESMSSYKKSVV